MSYLEIATAGTGVARDAHYIVPTGGTLPIRTLLLEPQRTNLCIRSEEFDTWTDSGTCNVTANSIAAPDSATTADLLTATTTASFRRRAVTFTGDGEKAFSLYVKTGTSTQSLVILRDQTAATSRHSVTVTWTAGVPTLATGAGAGTLYPVEALANGWYRILFSATGIVAANTNEVWVFPDTLVGTGTVYAWGAQAENAVVPSSYIPTAASTVTRNADSLYFPFTAPPQALTVYVRGVERERPSVVPPASQYIVHIGGSTVSTAARYSLVRSSSVAGYRAIHQSVAGLVQSGSVGSGTLRGDSIELRATLSTSGIAQPHVSITGGAEASGSASAASALDGSWADTRIWLAGTNGGDSMFAYTHVIVTSGEQTMDTMRQLAGVA
jgi:hypothetical protein